MKEIVKIEMDKWSWYDREMFKFYYTSGFSVTKITALTKISRSGVSVSLGKGNHIFKDILGDGFKAILNDVFDTPSKHNKTLKLKTYLDISNL